jgi:thiosulfate/3-mercaptopyruvate sulfurtransferase
MSPLSTPLIAPHELIALAHAPNLVLIDARAGAKDRYAAEHLTGARHVDLEQDLSNIGPDAAQGGRHPLPTMAQFSKVLSHLGIAPDSHVVVYDDKSAANAAARFWWMLRSIGHHQVQVLDGGYDAAIRAGFTVTDTVPALAHIRDYELTTWALPLANMQAVVEATTDPQCMIIDVRDAVRFNGETEPIDLIAGHIPQAVNVPFSKNLDANGFFRSPSELRSMYLEILSGRQSAQVIVHCGSGVTACHTLLAMDHAGLPIPQLYIGSWSEWSRNDLPMVTRV